MGNYPRPVRGGILDVITIGWVSLVCFSFWFTSSRRQRANGGTKLYAPGTCFRFGWGLLLPR